MIDRQSPIICWLILLPVIIAVIVPVIGMMYEGRQPIPEPIKQYDFNENLTVRDCHYCY